MGGNGDRGKPHHLPGYDVTDMLPIRLRNDGLDRSEDGAGEDVSYWMERLKKSGE